MSSSPLDAGESERLAALGSVPLDPTTKARLNELVELAAYTAHTPMAAISFLEAEQACCPASIGFDLSCVDRAHSFASTTLAAGNPQIISDASEHEVLAQNPLVSGPTGVRFYAGFPLRIDDHGIGVLLVADRRTRHLSPDEAHALRVIADQAAAQLKVAQLTRGAE